MQQNKEQQQQNKSSKQPSAPAQALPQPPSQSQQSETGSKNDLKTPSFIPVEKFRESEAPSTSASIPVTNHDEIPVGPGGASNIEPDSLDHDVNNENNGIAAGNGSEEPKSESSKGHVVGYYYRK